MVMLARSHSQQALLRDLPSRYSGRQGFPSSDPDRTRSRSSRLHPVASRRTRCGNVRRSSPTGSVNVNSVSACATPTLNSPLNDPSFEAAALTALTSFSSRRHRSMAACPAPVSTIGLVRRSRSVVPSDVSNRCNRRVTADCVMFRSRAARLTDPTVATVTKARTSSNSIYAY